MKFEAIKTLDGELQIRTVIPNMEGFPVATVHPERFTTACGDMTERDDWQTARLLAAAPDLLAAVRELAGMVEEMLPKAGPCKWGMFAVEGARAVIASVERGVE